MPRKGIHPITYMMRVVMKNGASIEVPTSIPRSTPYLLQKDPSNHPAWTGEEAGLDMADGRMARFLSKFEGYDVEGKNPSSREEAAAAAAARGGGDKQQGKPQLTHKKGKK